MCDDCDKVNPVRSFRTPQQYEDTVVYIKALVEQKGFVCIAGNCELGHHKKDGKWVDDIIWHEIQCPKCGQIFSASVNSYRGTGSFRKGR